MHTYIDRNHLLIAVLERIKEEHVRLYWNKFQKEINSPFLNNGPEGNYSNDTFAVKAYNWDDDSEPNFVWGPIKIWWYKHYMRCVEVECEEELTADLIQKMNDECLASLQADME